MGATFISETGSGALTPDELEERFNAARSATSGENGGDPYSGNWNTFDGLEFWTNQVFDDEDCGHSIRRAKRPGRDGAGSPLPSRHRSREVADRRLGEMVNANLPPLPPAGLRNGYRWMEGLANGWYVVRRWGRDGWPLANWPRAIVVHYDGREVYGLGVYLEDDVAERAFQTRAERDASTDRIAAVHWRQNGLGPQDMPAPHDDLASHCRGSYSPGGVRGMNKVDRLDIPNVGMLTVRDLERVDDELRREFGYTMSDATGKLLELGADLRSAALEYPSARVMLYSLLTFLDGAPESFRPATEEWAKQHSDELAAARLEIGDELGEQQW